MNGDHELELMQPSAQPSSSKSADPSPKPSGSGGGGSPPVSGTRSRIAEAYETTTKQTQRATVMVSVCLLVNLLLPPGDQLATEVFGIKGDNLKAFPPLACLALSVLLSHVSATLARGARLARAFGDDLEVTVVVSEKLQADATTDDSPTEASLLQNTSGRLAHLYLAFRILERFLSYLLFLAILVVGFWIAATRTFSLYLSWADSPVTVVCVVGCCALLLLAIFRLAQYWLLRVQTFGDSLPRETVGFPRKYSLTSVAGIGAWAILSAIWFGVLRPTLRLFLRRWKSRALATYPQQRQPGTEGTETLEDVISQLKAMGAHLPDYPSRTRKIPDSHSPRVRMGEYLYSLWIRFLRSLWDEHDIK